MAVPGVVLFLMSEVPLYPIEAKMKIQMARKKSAESIFWVAPECIYDLISESQLPHKLVNLIF